MRRNNRIFVAFSILFGFNLFAWLTVYDLNKPHFLEVTFFDVGQGDAIFIETPQRQQILIDGGPTSIILERLGKEMPFWDRTIDLIILTHPEHDHLAGLLEVLKRYKVENILWTGVIRDTLEFKEWERLIEEEKNREGAGVKIAQAGQQIICSRLNLEQCGYIDVLYPFENLEGKKVKNSNNTSIVAKLVFGQNSFLFTGDAYKSVERKLVDRSFNSPGEIDSDILKVGHHGSKTSSAPEFIARVLPEIAVISVGKNNPYHHPHQETLDTLEKYGKILRTDLNGDIKIISDGINYVSNF